MLMLDSDLELRPEPFRSRWIIAQAADAVWQQRAYYELRRQVFVVEQGLFREHDRDRHDSHALPIVALSTCSGVPDDVVGVVRIYRDHSGAAENLWFGGRLAVVSNYRRSAEVGTALIRAAVGAARGLGARRFLATVQEENVAYFSRQHFHALESVSVCGKPHRLMEADLHPFAIPGWLVQLANPHGRAA